MQEARKSMGGIEMAIQSYEDLKVFNLAYDTAMVDDR